MYPWSMHRCCCSSLKWQTYKFTYGARPRPHHRNLQVLEYSILFGKLALAKYYIDRPTGLSLTIWIASQPAKSSKGTGKQCTSSWLVGPPGSCASLPERQTSSRCPVLLVIASGYGWPALASRPCRPGLLETRGRWGFWTCFLSHDHEQAKETFVKLGLEAFTYCQKISD